MILRVVLSVLLALVSSIGATGQAIAQSPTPCFPLVEVIQWLADSYGESPSVQLITDTENIIVVWINTETSTWTLTVTRPDTTTCLLSSGSGITTLAASLPPNI